MRIEMQKEKNKLQTNPLAACGSRRGSTWLGRGLTLCLSLFPLMPFSLLCLRLEHSAIWNARP